MWKTCARLVHSLLTHGQRNFFSTIAFGILLAPHGALAFVHHFA